MAKGRNIASCCPVAALANQRRNFSVSFFAPECRCTIQLMSDFTVDIERETDSRWIGEVSELSGVLVYGSTREEAVAKAKALAFRVLADRLEHGGDIPEIQGVFAV